MLIGTGVSGGGKRRGGGAPRRYTGRRRRGQSRRYSLKPSPSFTRGVLAVVKPESKFFFSTHKASTSLGTPFFLFLDDMKQGTDSSGRVGNEITPTVLYGHVIVEGNHLGDDDSAGVRIVIIQWHDDQNNSPMDPDEILQETAQPGGPWKVQSKGLFSVVWSKFVSISQRRDNSQFLKTCSFDVKIRKRPNPLWNGDILKKHHYHILAFTDAGGGADFVTVNAQVQLRYTD